MSAARTFQAIRAHVPMIKFPSRLQGATGTMSVPSSSQTQPTSSQVSRPSSLDIFEEVPLRFRRQEISPEEMAYIERGGPE